ncbi:Flp family type IVb pilin [Thalassobacillus devorans]|uniref:Flp family type IVb pilin n=1 Tax=Thalassobacillus devorans TaxID=279813 RepID=UPI00049217BD|nr:Flp family type IVb pilin [Thalassobacillus devorans]
MNTLTRLWKEEEGQALSEYGLIIGLIAIVCIAAMGWVAGGIQNLFGRVANELTP